MQVAVETLGASAVCLANQAVLTLYADGHTEGVVVDCGEGVTQVVPIYEGRGRSDQQLLPLFWEVATRWKTATQIAVNRNAVQYNESLI